MAIMVHAPTPIAHQTAGRLIPWWQTGGQDSAAIIRSDPDRAGYRHSVAAGSVTLGGRRVPVSRPRVRASDGSGELPVSSYELFSGTELLGELAMERMLAGIS